MGLPLMLHVTPIVFVVDDDISVRESLESLIRCEGWQPETFASAQEFLDRPRVLIPNCLVLDVSLPGLNGLDLQGLVAGERTDMPIIFITGHGDVPMTVRRPLPLALPIPAQTRRWSTRKLSYSYVNESRGQVTDGSILRKRVRPPDAIG